VFAEGFEAIGPRDSLRSHVFRLFMPPRLAVPAAALLAWLAAATPAQGQAAVDPPENRTLVHEGHDGRYLLGGRWLFRRDEANVGERDRYFAQRGSGGWSTVQVPHAWNAGDDSRASMAGGVVWYRRDFRLPSSSAGLAWIVRFQSVRYRARVWLNGREIGRHAGAYVPFELDLGKVSRRGVNRLVVRVDNRMRRGDIPTVMVNEDGDPSGGWWNYGGLLGEVYLRRVSRVDLPVVRVLPDLPCRTCAGRIRFKVRARSYARRPQRVRVTARYGDRRISLGARVLPARGSAMFERTLSYPQPHLWSPPDPHLYDVSVAASAGGARAGYQLLSGIRSIRVQNGQVLLNHQPMQMRGAFLHEDHPERGSALTNADREAIIARAEDLGATALRTHYPFQAHTHELADRHGLLIWDEIPFFQLRSEFVAKSSVRNAAKRMMRENILANGNHPSVFVWSAGNELSANPGSVHSRYFREIDTLIERLDPTRPSAYVFAGYLFLDCEAAYSRFDILGLNSYFGWYPGSRGSIADRDLLPEFLDRMRACYPAHGLMVTEFGAEANREGPAEERGTYGFQAELLDYHLSVYATKPWLGGAMTMLQGFRVRPGWYGGDPRVVPPFHEKGVIDFHGNRKPGFFTAQRWYRSTDQYGAARR
jgi:beta-glucuronidase